jgi:hypothetical protein
MLVQPLPATVGRPATPSSRRQEEKRSRREKSRGKEAPRPVGGPLLPTAPLRYAVASLEHWLDLNA